MQDYIDSRLDNFKADLKKLVNQDSSSLDIKGLTKIADFFEARLCALGLKVRRVSLGERGVPCLEASNLEPGGTADVMLLGHMDTVFEINEAAARPFSIQNGRAMGPGVCDMKAGLTLALYILETLHHHGKLNTLKVILAFNGDEEVGSGASRDWIKGLARRSKRVLVFEPARLDYRFVLHRKGLARFTVDCHGRAAHSGADSKKGANAIWEMAKLVLQIQEFGQSLPDSIINVTRIQGGKKTNIIPEHAQAKVDVRIASLEEGRRIEAFFQDLPKQASVPGVRIEVSGGVDRGPLEPGPEAFELWSRLEDTAKELDMEIGWLATGGVSDGNFCSTLGVPTIDGLGPVGGGSHTKDEFVELASVGPMLRLLSRFCMGLSKAL
jgi:glutamate carboxypeptidase